jgi:hypothetical protein
MIIDYVGQFLQKMPDIGHQPFVEIERPSPSTTHQLAAPIRDAPA